MITSSQFFNKTFFQIEEDGPPMNKVYKSLNNQKQTNPIYSKSIPNRYSDLTNPQHLSALPSSTRSHINNSSILSHTKKPCPLQHVQNDPTQIQFLQNKPSKNTRKYHSSFQYMMDQSQYNQSTIDVSPWQHESQTSRQLYDMKRNIKKEREKIKEMISRYKWSKTIEENKKEEGYANFIKSPKKNKKVNFVLFDCEELQKKEKKSENHKTVNRARNVDMNETYEMYLNHEIDFDKELIFRPFTKSHKKGKNSSKNCLSRQGKLPFSQKHTKSPSKQQLITSLQKDLKCAQYLNDSRHKNKSLLTSSSNDLQSSHQQQQKTICHAVKISQRKKMMEKAKYIKVENGNRKLLKGGKIQGNGIGFQMRSKGDYQERKHENKKICLQVSGNKTRKLEFSVVTQR